MDKRTLIFVISLTLTLFLVNTYFEGQRTEDLKDWHSQNRAKTIEQILQLENDIKQRSVTDDQVGIVPLFHDPSVENFASYGVHIDGGIITIKTDKEVADEVYTGRGTPHYDLKYISPDEDNILLYFAEPNKSITIGDLPYFGQYDLYVVTFHPEDPKKPYQAVLADYTDGHFSIPLKKLRELQTEVEVDTVKDITIKHNSIVLRKIDNRFVPVAIYMPGSDSLLHLSQMPSLPVDEVAAPEKSVIAGEKTDEKFYVLENDYQQLVFSTHGAALAEINLPFQTEANEKSVVKEIGFDRQMVEEHPYNALFPARPYYTPGNEKHAQGKLGGYYPLLRRDLIETGHRKSVRVLPGYYALNIVSEYPETAELNFEVKEFTKNRIVFEAKQRQRRITKTYTLGDAPYTFDVDIKIDGDARGLWLTSGVPEAEWISNAPAPTMKYRITRNQKSEVLKLDLPKETITMSTVQPDWLCNSNGFLGLILDPLTDIEPGLRAQLVPGTTLPSKLVEIDEDHDRFQAKDLPGYLMMLPLKAGSMQFRVFAGPFSDSILKTVDALYTIKETGYNPDYISCQSYHGWFAFISAPFAKFLFILMNFFHTLTGSWAFSIILLTIALRVMLYPLNAWSTKSMIKMQQISPRVQKIQEKYGKKDPKKAQLEIMNLYRDEGVNPVSGCFPILIQMPFLFGMFDLLKSSFELRGAPFIPGWIDDLAAPDVLFSWETPIPFIGNSFHLLPILLGLVMFVQQRMMSTLPKDPNEWTEQQRQQRAMGSMMAFFFAFMFYKFPSGLNIYWLSSMLLGILQQWWTQKQLKKS